MEFEYTRDVDEVDGVQLERESVEYGDDETDAVYRIRGKDGKIVASMTVEMESGESLATTSRYQVSGELTADEFMEEWTELKAGDAESILDEEVDQLSGTETADQFEAGY